LLGNSVVPVERAHQGSVPVPDPTRLTTDAVDKAKADIEKLFDVKIDGFRELVTEQFKGRDLALAAAFKAQQEQQAQQNNSNTVANDKMSDGFTKQIENLEGKIDDLKDRISDIGRKDWATVGAYIVGALGVAGLIAAAVIHHVP
jgi:hypothetical protein